MGFLPPRVSWNVPKSGWHWPVMSLALVFFSNHSQWSAPGHWFDPEHWNSSLGQTLSPSTSCSAERTHFGCISAETEPGWWVCGAVLNLMHTYQICKLKAGLVFWRRDGYVYRHRQKPEDHMILPRTQYLWMKHHVGLRFGPDRNNVADLKLLVIFWTSSPHRVCQLTTGPIHTFSC